MLRRHVFLMAAWCSFCLIDAPFSSFVIANFYPLFGEGSLEIHLVLAAAMVTGNALLLVSRQVGMVIISIAVTFYLYLFNELHLQIHWLTNEYVLLLIILLFAAGFSRLKKNGWVLMLTISTSILVVSWSGELSRSDWMQETYQSPITRTDASLPSVVHIVFDELTSPDALPDELESAREAKRMISQFHRKYGFYVFSNAYSSFFDSRYSLSATMNPGDMLTAEHFVANAVSSWRSQSSLDDRVKYFLSSNEVFREAALNGYNIAVYQSTYMDFCNSALDKGIVQEQLARCVTYDYSFGALTEINISRWHKATVILGHFFGEYERFKNIWFRMRNVFGDHLAVLPVLDIPLNRITPVSARRPMTELFGNIKESPRGTYFFAHLLIPHYPYVFDRNCQIRSNPTEWLWRSEWGLGVVTSNLARIQRYDQYSEQVICLFQMLDAQFEKLRQEELLDKVVFIIHGDHGSRIVKDLPYAEIANKSKLDDQLISDAFSTYLSIRAEGIESGVQDQPVSVHEIPKAVLSNIGQLGNLIPMQSKPYLVLFPEGGGKPETEFVNSY